MTLATTSQVDTEHGEVMKKAFSDCSRYETFDKVQHKEGQRKKFVTFQRSSLANR